MAVPSDIKPVFQRVERVLADEFGGNESEMARALGMPQSSLHRALNPGPKNRERTVERRMREVIDRLVNQVGYNREWVEKGQGDMLLPGQGDGDHGEPPEPEAKDDTIRYVLPRLKSRGTAGSGAKTQFTTAPDEEETVLVRSRSEIRRYTGYNPESLRPIFIPGNSMYPDIMPNTEALYLPMHWFEGSGIYALSLGNLTIVKVVDLLAGGAIQLSSKNKSDYPDTEMLIPLPDADEPNTFRSELTGLVSRVRVVGRIVLYTKST